MAEVPDTGASLSDRLAAVAEPAELLRDIFASTPVGLQIYDRSGKSVLVNAAHTELFGAVPPPEYNIFEDSVLEANGLLDNVRRAFAGERISMPTIWYDARELRNLPPDSVSGARRIAVAAELVPLRDRAGEVSHILFVFHDLTRAEEAREDAEAAARRAERARQQAEARAGQATFFAHAGRLLSASLDLDITLSQIARLATSALSDFCVIDLVAPDGMRRVAAMHADPAKQALLEELRVKFPPKLDSSQPAATAIATGEPDYSPELDSASIAAKSQNAEHAELIRKLDIRSVLAYPLRLGSRVLGAISLGHTSDTRFTDADFTLIEALASNAAVAIENARLFRDAHEARTQAETASRAKDEFLAMLGHELRNPLAPIVTALDLTRDGEIGLRERSIIERQVDHLRRLVDDLLDVSRITRGLLELDCQPLDLADAVADGIELARPLVEQREHTVEIDIPQGLVVSGDRTRIAQIVANLMTNAARYTEPRGRISVTGQRRSREIVLHVRDTGIGMPAELVPHVFETFTRGSHAIDRAAGGLGLGLAIVKSLAQLHGGRVAARSDGPGMGSELEVVLPALDSAPTVRPTAAPLPSPRARADHGVVLVVDANVDAAELMSDALQLQGFAVVTANDGAQALALAREHRPAVGLLDLGLPGMDGFELARELLSEPLHARMKLVALTGYGQASDRDRTRAAGFVEHLVKPIKLSTLIPLLEQLLARPS